MADHDHNWRRGGRPEQIWASPPGANVAHFSPSLEVDATCVCGAVDTHKIGTDEHIVLEPGQVVQLVPGIHALK